MSVPTPADVFPRLEDYIQKVTADARERRDFPSAPTMERFCDRFEVRRPGGAVLVVRAHHCHVGNVSIVFTEKTPAGRSRTLLALPADGVTVVNLDRQNAIGGDV